MIVNHQKNQRTLFFKMFTYYVIFCFEAAKDFAAEFAPPTRISPNASPKVKQVGKAFEGKIFRQILFFMMVCHFFLHCLEAKVVSPSHQKDSRQVRSNQEHLLQARMLTWTI